VRHRYLVIVSLLGLLASGCASRSLESYKTKTDDEAQILIVLTKFQTGVNNKSVDILMQPYAEDVYVGNFHKYVGVAGPGANMRVSKPDLRQAYTQLFKYVKEISVDVKDFTLKVQGDRAVAEATTDLLIKVESGRKEAKSEVIRNEVTWRLKRGPLGWKIQEEIFH
jgi:ketosteroid isomerase-like protein